jgi:hypothetical protein
MSVTFLNFFPSLDFVSSYLADNRSLLPMPASLRRLAIAESEAHLGTAEEHERAGSGLAIDTYSPHLDRGPEPTSDTSSGYQWKTKHDHEACGPCANGCTVVRSVWWTDLHRSNPMC